MGIDGGAEDETEDRIAREEHQQQGAAEEAGPAASSNGCWRRSEHEGAAPPGACRGKHYPSYCNSLDPEVPSPDFAPVANGAESPLGNHRGVRAPRGAPQERRQRKGGRLPVPPAPSPRLVPSRPGRSAPGGGPGESQDGSGARASGRSGGRGPPSAQLPALPRDSCGSAELQIGGARSGCGGRKALAAPRRDRDRRRGAKKDRRPQGEACCRSCRRRCHCWLLWSEATRYALPSAATTDCRTAGLSSSSSSSAAGRSRRGKRRRTPGADPPPVRSPPGAGACANRRRRRRNLAAGGELRPAPPRHPETTGPPATGLVSCALGSEAPAGRRPVRPSQETSWQGRTNESLPVDRRSQGRQRSLSDGEGGGGRDFFSEISRPGRFGHCVTVTFSSRVTMTSSSLVFRRRHVELPVFKMRRRLHRETTK
jgi:hypothetical protein